MKIQLNRENQVSLLISRKEISSLLDTPLKDGEIIAECSLENFSKKYEGQNLILIYRDNVNGGFDCSGKIKNNSIKTYINKNGLSNLIKDRNIRGKFLGHPLHFETPVGTDY